MQVASHDNFIVLIRAAPQSDAGKRALAIVAASLQQCSGLVVAFFHGSAVSHAARSHAEAWTSLAGHEQRLVLEVCSAAWQRRHGGEPAAPFVRSSLVRFWHRASSGYQVLSVGESP